MRILSAMATVLAIGLAACGGGGGAGSGASCSGTTVYDSYGYENQNVYTELGVQTNIRLIKHVFSGCDLKQQLSGALPSGLSFDSDTGNISGTPVESGIFNVTVRPQAGGTVQSGVQIRVDPIGPQSPQLTATQVSASIGLPNVTGGSLAKVSASGTALLYYGGIAASGQYQVFKSGDLGGSWSAIDTSTIPPPPSTSSDISYGSIVLIEANGSLHLFESGVVSRVALGGGSFQSTQLAPRLFKLEDTGWIQLTSAVPFAPTSTFDTYRIYTDSGTFKVVSNPGLFSPSTVWSSTNGTDWAQESDPGYSTFGNVCVGRAQSDLRVISGAGGTADLYRLPAGGAWSSRSWINTIEWSPAVMQPTNLCASARGRYWLLGTASDLRTTMIASFVEGQFGPEYPRRIGDLGVVWAVVEVGGDLIVFSTGSNATQQVWRLH